MKGSVVAAFACDSWELGFFNIDQTYLPVHMVGYRAKRTHVGLPFSLMNISTGNNICETYSSLLQFLGKQVVGQYCHLQSRRSIHPHRLCATPLDLETHGLKRYMHRATWTQMRYSLSKRAPNPSREREPFFCTLCVPTENDASNPSRAGKGWGPPDWVMPMPCINRRAHLSLSRTSCCTVFSILCCQLPYRIMVTTPIAYHRLMVLVFHVFSASFLYL